MRTRIFVSGKTLRSNAVLGKDDPPVSVNRDGSDPVLCHEAVILGGATVRHSQNNPTEPGVNVWIETDAEVLVL